MKKNNSGGQMYLSVLICILCAATLSSQSLWTDHEAGNSLSVEALKPFRTDSLSSGFSAPSGTLFFTGRYALKQRLILVGELSVVHGELKSDLISNKAETVLGNPYLGAEFYLAESPFFIDAGFRIPIISKDKDVAYVVGGTSDVNRFEAFIPEIFPLLVGLNYKTISDKKILFRARLGSSFIFNSGNVFGASNSDFIFDYTAQTGYIGEKLHALVGFTGRYLASLPYSPPETDLRNILKFGSTITLPLGNTRLGVHFKIPINDNAAETLDIVAGFNFVYNFQGASVAKKVKTIN